MNLCDPGRVVRRTKNAHKFYLSHIRYFVYWILVHSINAFHEKNFNSSIGPSVRPPRGSRKKRKKAFTFPSLVSPPPPSSHSGWSRNNQPRPVTPYKMIYSIEAVTPCN